MQFLSVPQSGNVNLILHQPLLHIFTHIIEQQRIVICGTAVGQLQCIYIGKSPMEQGEILFAAAADAIIVHIL